MSLERRGDSRARSIDGPSPGPVPAPAAPPSSSSTARDGEEHPFWRHLFGLGVRPGALGKFGFFVTGLHTGRFPHRRSGVSSSLPFACLFRESARTCPIARRACARWRLAKVTRKPNSHLNRLEGATPASISRRPRSPSLAGGSPRGMRFGYRFSPRSALLAAGRGLRRRARRRDGRRSDPNGARSPGPSSTITGPVPARVRSRFDPRDAPTGSQPRHGTALGKRVTGT